MSTENKQSIIKGMLDHQNLKTDLKNWQLFNKDSRVLGRQAFRENQMLMNNDSSAMDLKANGQYKIPLNTYLDHYTELPILKNDPSKNSAHRESAKDGAFDNKNAKFKLDNTGPVYPQHNKPTSELPSHPNFTKIMQDEHKTSCLQKYQHNEGKPFSSGVYPPFIKGDKNFQSTDNLLKKQDDNDKIKKNATKLNYKFMNQKNQSLSPDQFMRKLGNNDALKNT